MGIPKYVRDRATARLEVSRLSGVSLDMDDVPRGTVSENDARCLCSKYGMRFDDDYRSAAALFKALETKLGRTPRFRRKKPQRENPLDMDKGETDLFDVYTGELMLTMPFRTHMEYGSNSNLVARHRIPRKEDDQKDKPTYSQGRLF